MLNDALLQMQRRLDDNDLTEAGGAAGIKLRLRSSEKRRFTRSSASGEHTKQSTFQTTKDDSVFLGRRVAPQHFVEGARLFFQGAFCGDLDLF